MSARLHVISYPEVEGRIAAKEDAAAMGNHGPLGAGGQILHDGSDRPDHESRLPSIRLRRKDFKVVAAQSWVTRPKRNAVRFAEAIEYHVTVRVLRL